MRFEIKAYRSGVGVSSLTIDSANAEEAARTTRAQGFEIVALREISRWAQSANVFRGLTKRPAKSNESLDLLLFSQELRALLDAGLSLIEGLGALAQKQRAGGGQRLVRELIRHLREGKSFSQSLREFPAVFPPLFLALAAASEQTGDLAGALGRFIDYRTRMNTVRERVVSATLYPAVLMTVGCGVILFLVAYVVPRFSRIYEEFGGQLPLMSRLLLQLGTLISNHGGQIGVVLLALVAGVVVLLRKQSLSWRELLPKLLRWKSLEALRERYQIYVLARFYRTVGLLLQGGLPVATALGMSRELLDAEMQGGLNRALIGIRGGVAISEAMKRGDLAPAVASDLLKTGERTGDMGDKMIRIADFHDQETERMADRFARLFEPLLTLTIGLFIAFIVVLLYMPIFELAGSIQ